VTLPWGAARFDDAAAQTVTGGGGGGLLVDSLVATPIMAFSTRKLRSAYAGSALKVTTSAGGNATTDIGFDGSNNLNTTTLASAIGSNTGTIASWYDQMALNDFGQATLSKQPRIVNAGTNDTINGHVALNFLGTAAQELGSSTGFSSAQPLTLAICFKMNDVTVSGAYFTDGASRMIIGADNVPEYTIYANGGSGNNGGVPETTNVHTIIAVFNTTSGLVYLDGTQIITCTDLGTAGFSIGQALGNGQGGPGMKAYIMEVLWFSSVIGSTDRGTIRSSWQTYWGAI
jgi:hypothetical protein